MLHVPHVDFIKAASSGCVLTFVRCMLEVLIQYSLPRYSGGRRWINQSSKVVGVWEDLSSPWEDSIIKIAPVVIRYAR